MLGVSANEMAMSHDQIQVEVFRGQPSWTPSEAIEIIDNWRAFSEPSLLCQIKDAVTQMFRTVIYPKLRFVE